MLVFWAGVGCSHPAQSKAIGIQSYTEKALFKKGKLGLPRYVTWSYVSSQPETEIFLVSVRSTVGIAHCASIYNTFYHWIAKKRSIAPGADDPLLRNGYSLRWIMWRQGRNWGCVISTYRLPLYLVLHWKENYGHASKYFDLQIMASMRKPCALSDHIASSAWCPKIIIYTVSLSFTTLYLLGLSSDSFTSEIYFFWNVPRGLLNCDPVTVPHNDKIRNLVFISLLSFLANRFLTTVKFKLPLASTTEVQWFLEALSRGVLLMGAGQDRNPFGHQFHRSVGCATGVILVLCFLLLILFMVFFLRKDKWVLHTHYAN